MLSCEPMSSNVKTPFQAYISDVLGLAIEVKPTVAHLNALPYFLREVFTFEQAELCGQEILLLIDKGTKALTASELSQWLAKARQLVGLPCVYVTGSMASHQRRRLIEHKVPFVVPGNQLYLPDLGLDLREYFKQKATPDPDGLSPSAQLLLLRALLREELAEPWHPVEELKLLGYTAMTVSRAVRDLVAARLVTTQKRGRVVELMLSDAPAVVWDRAQPLLKSPVQRLVWVNEAEEGIDKLPLAGGSALASLSMLNPPRNEVRAAYRADWAELRKRIDTLPAPEKGAVAIQVWTYPPLHQGVSQSVDHLSLMLSFKDERDDRIQIALDELRESLPW